VLLPNLSLTEDVHGLLSALLPIISSTLVVLDVANCYLDALPQALARCQVLEELNLSENPLTALPPWLGQLSSLRVLVVDGCSLKQLPIELMNTRNLHTICGELESRGAGRISTADKHHTAQLDGMILFHSRRGCLS
jgi:Leucine-rich repeat (LRR) protein